MLIQLSTTKNYHCWFCKIIKKYSSIFEEKGSDTESRLKRNFGMMRPEGYRKCIRLMKSAEKFGIPVVCFVDTPGAYPGKGAEERGQAEAIAKSIDCCLSISQPIISVVIVIARSA